MHAADPRRAPGLPTSPDVPLIPALRSPTAPLPPVLASARPAKETTMKRFILRTLPILTVLAIGLLPLIGADEVGAPAAKNSVNAFQMILAAGWTEWQIILLSVIAFAVAIQLFITLKREVIIPPGIAEDLHNCFAQSDPTYVSQVIASAIDKKDFGYDAMVAAAECTATAETNRWNGKIGWLALFASIGTMMGLFGTVWGMIGAFMAMAANPAGVDAAMLAGTIGGALITTANGLIVAIPMLICVFILRGRLNQYILDATVISNEILDYFRPAR